MECGVHVAFSDDSKYLMTSSGDETDISFSGGDNGVINEIEDFDEQDDDIIRNGICHFLF